MQKTDNHKRFSRPTLPAVLLVCSVVLFLVAWKVSRDHLKEKIKDKFEYRVSNIESNIRARMSAYEQVLRSGVGLFQAGDTVTRTQWRSFVHTLRLGDFYPGIQGIGFTVRLHPQEVERLTKKVRSEGFPDFKVWPEGEREEYHSIIYLEPFQGRNLRAFGYDMYTGQKRRQAMQRAAETGQPALSQMLVLVQETGKDVQKGCLMYLPVYNRNRSLATVQERQAALKGFVYSPFRINDLMHGILGAVPPEVEFEIYDGTGTDTLHLFYTSHGYRAQKHKADLSTIRSLEVAGHHWTLVFTSRPQLVSSFEANQPNIIAIAGILVNLFLLFVLMKIHSLSSHNRHLAERFKAEKERYEIVSLSTNDIIWEWDLLSNTFHFNQNYQTVLGYQQPGSGISFDTWISHLHPDDREQTVLKLHAFARNHAKFWSGEYRLLKADGSSIYILDRGRLIYDSSGHAVSMVGSMINITERRQAEEAQIHFNEELEKTVQARTIALQKSNEDLERFAHVTSHDLKEPVRKMLISIDLLKARYQNKLGEGVLLVDKLAKSASRLNQMIESVLAYSTVNYESKKAEPVNLNEIMQHICEDLELIIAEKKAHISFSALPIIEGSPVLLYQLFYNLVHNALKFSRDGVQPVIAIHSAPLSIVPDEIVQIKVADNGIGFNPEEAPKIFQSFVRLHPKDRYEGTGLGLALCQRITERHGGTIEAFGSPGKGATFILHLPMKQPGSLI